ncbi:MAG: nucleotidyltransferase domain-containing protein [Candidatus Obscuribacterales bacterium]|nr:nucleotidyltransferase domain-containing protein [Candidatus Obscuribacterales bacterium]
MAEKIAPELAAREIWQERYPDAKAVFLCGSVIRGEGTRFSDLDLVVVFEKLEYAWRESFYYKNWPIEAFVHDISTLNYFFYEMDAKSGCPSLPQMVTEGIVVSGATELSDSLKRIARDILDKGPSALTADELDRRRYAITDLLDDLRDPRSSSELTAVGTQLFGELADYYFRSKGLWSATGKTVIRRFNAVNPALGAKYENAFHQLFADSNPAACIVLAEEILSDCGGLLFDGYRLNAPASWKLD